MHLKCLRRQNMSTSKYIINITLDKEENGYYIGN